MAKIEKYERKVMPPGGESLPGGNFYAIKQAGIPGESLQQAGRAIAGIGETIAAMHTRQIDAQEAIDAQKNISEANLQVGTMLNKNIAEIKDPLAFRDTAVESLKEILSKTGDGASKGVKRRMDAHITDLSVRTQLKIQEQTFVKTHDQGQAVITQEEDRLLNKALSAYQSGDMEGGKESIQEYETMLDNFDSVVIGNEEAEKRRQRFKENVAITGFTQALQTNPGKIGKDIDGAIKAFGLSPEQAIRARGMAEREVAQAKAKFDYTRNYSVNNVIRTGEINPSIVNTAKDMLGEDEYKAFESDMQRAEELHGITKQFGGMSAGQVYNTIEAYNPSNKAYQYKDDETFQKDVQNYATLYDIAEKTIANKGRVMTKEAGKDFVNTFMMSPPEIKTSMMQELITTYGKDARKALNELTTEHQLPSEAYLMTEVDPYVASKLSSISKVSKTILRENLGDIKKANKIETDVFDYFYEGFGATIPPSHSKAYNTYKDIADKLALLYAREPNISNPAKQAYNDLFGNYTVSGTLAIPPGYNAKAVNEFANYMKYEGLVKKADEIETGGYGINEWLTVVESTGQWYINDTGDGMELYINSMPAMYTDGKPIGFSFAEAQLTPKVQSGLDIGGYPSYAPITP